MLSAREPLGANWPAAARRHRPRRTRNSSRNPPPRPASFCPLRFERLDKLGGTTASGLWGGGGGGDRGGLGGPRIQARICRTADDQGLASGWRLYLCQGLRESPLRGQQPGRRCAQQPTASRIRGIRRRARSRAPGQSSAKTRPRRKLRSRMPRLRPAMRSRHCLPTRVDGRRPTFANVRRGPVRQAALRGADLRAQPSGRQDPKERQAGADQALCRERRRELRATPYVRAKEAVREAATHLLLPSFARLVPFLSEAKRRYYAIRGAEVVVRSVRDGSLPAQQTTGHPRHQHHGARAPQRTQRHSTLIAAVARLMWMACSAKDGSADVRILQAGMAQHETDGLVERLRLLCPEWAPLRPCRTASSPVSPPAVDADANTDDPINLDLAQNTTENKNSEDYDHDGGEEPEEHGAKISSRASTSVSFIRDFSYRQLRVTFPMVERLLKRCDPKLFRAVPKATFQANKLLIWEFCFRTSLIRPSAGATGAAASFRSVVYGRSSIFVNFERRLTNRQATPPSVPVREDSFDYPSQKAQRNGETRLDWQPAFDQRSGYRCRQAAAHPHHGGAGVGDRKRFFSPLKHGPDCSDFLELLATAPSQSR
ncbi:hypothetical protein M427DRAFT_428265 [Gonapodya prolifera JEL478]|uniref:Uncharacterized protein n=1 Tax=Gonapodya prolifera (strain JEL478) TaxID=1344416 RepID=A0A139AT36_GONPJ|nr:hypothetical protein M427DRAFT_428265 [Gonapodya prolifera JEL478]|eukprot:KXS19723.1 hypothetical protein M427DRAFT_428265 [Gonapodya prolifera JEL478]